MKKKIEYVIMVLLIIGIITGLSIVYIGIEILDFQVPIARYGHGAVYDPQIKKTIIFGGYQEGNPYLDNFLNDMWIYDSTSNLWRENEQTNKPSIRMGHRMIYDTFNRKTILFGGLDESLGLRNDTWIYNSHSNQWTEVFPLFLSPDSRRDHAMCYDPVNHLAILFGGYGGTGLYLSDTWVYDYNINMWFELTPTNSPSGRYGAKMVYDPVNQRGILFGGRALSIMNDTWAYYYDSNTWAELETTGNPDTRYGHGMVYDLHHQKVILFGGNHLGNFSGILEDTWIFNSSNNKWTEILTQEQPDNRMYFSMVYDSFNRKTILFGGWDSRDPRYNIMGSTWTYTYNSTSWVAVKPQSRSV